MSGGNVLKKRLREWLSRLRARYPARLVLMVILLFNVLFILLSAFIIRSLTLSGTEDMSFLEAVFYTITMILDAGCISFVVEDIGQAGLAVAVFCLLIILIGMVTFTGAVIGYVTNYISGFIDDPRRVTRRIAISNHFVIMNWNTRASEIVNELLYCKGHQKVLVLVKSGKEAVQKEVEERLLDTIERENAALREKCRELGWLQAFLKYRREHLKNNIELILREGDVFSAKQLHDISVETARTVIILSDERNYTEGHSGKHTSFADQDQGNVQIIKALMVVADITGAQYSADNQRIIVEITDDWTGELVDKIIERKQVAGKCNIVPIRVNQLLGQLLAQICIMPELNLAYRELFSNKGATFQVEERQVEDEEEYISGYLQNHLHAIPLTGMQSDGKDFFFYSSAADSDLSREASCPKTQYTVAVNEDYWIEKKTVIILGHNSKSRELMKGFSAFRNEWNSGDEILKIIVIDDAQSLEKLNHYAEYPFVTETVEASVYDKDTIYETIERIVNANTEDTSILILSDDAVSAENLDTTALAYLVYVQDIVARKKREIEDFDEESIDIIVEIINPKHYDIVSSYSVNNVVISNRYISKMITQIGEKDAIFNLYQDILTYDEADVASYESKEVYIKKVTEYFRGIPETCTEAEFIRAVWAASTDPSLPPEKKNPALALGYVKPGGRVRLFEGDQTRNTMRLEAKDKVILFSAH